MRLMLLPLLSLALGAAPPASFHDLTAESLEGKPMPLAAFRGQVVLVVNVASECGFTPQYEGLQKLQETYGPRGFSVLGFPCNQFGGQEPGSPQAIQSFCSTRFHVTFPMGAKVEVKGPGQSPVYAFLTRTQPEPRWNFHKYLVSREGQVLRSFPSKVAPEDPELKAALEAALR